MGATLNASLCISILLGILVSMIPNGLFKRIQAVGLSEAKQIVRRFYIGGVAKFGVLLFLLLIIFQWHELNSKLFLGGFLITEFIRLLRNWFGLLRLKK